MAKIASIDIGTNSVLYSLFEIKGKKLEESFFRQHTPRIGSQLKNSKKPIISEENYRKLLGILKREQKHAKNNGADEILIAATNPLRLAKNGRQISKRLETELRLPVEILSPEREAYLSVLGAVGKLKTNQTAVVIDLGGGSTELVVYKGNNQKAFVSLPDGAVSITERFDTRLKADINKFDEYDECLSQYNRAIEIIKPYANNPLHLVGGTSSSLGYLTDQKFFAKSDGTLISAHKLSEIVELLSGSNLTARRKLLFFDKERAEIIFAGLFFYRYLFRQLGIKKARANPRGLRHGLVIDFIN